MNTNKELDYRLYIQREEEFHRTELQREFSRYEDIKNGNVEQVAENFRNIKKNFYEGKGLLSDDLLRNNIYHLVIGNAIIARVCIYGGMNHDVAYTLSDIYIRRADRCRKPEEVIDLIGEMQVDFATRMRRLRKEQTISLHIRHAVDYIYQHLHEPLTLASIAAHLNLNPSYLSKLFSKEMHMPIKAYILHIRIETAKNILTLSDYPISDISASLNFSSQSAFTASFKKTTGYTPARYRVLYSDSLSLWNSDSKKQE